MNHPPKFRSATFALAFALLTGGSLFATKPAEAAPGDIGTIFQVNDDDPLQNIPSDEERNQHPLEFGYYLQDLIARAQGALQKKDWARAAKYFETIARIVPNQAITFSRLCTCYAELGRIDVAAANCGRATQLPGALVIDHLRFAKYTLQKAKFTTDDAANIDASLAFLRAQKPELMTPPATSAPAPAAPKSSAPSAASTMSATGAAANVAPAPSASSDPDHPHFTYEEYQKQLHRGMEPEKAETHAAAPVNLPLEVETLGCQLAVRLEDSKRLSACVDGLRRVHADPRLVVSFEWSQALISKDGKRADEILDQAKALKMPDSALRAMEAEQNTRFKPAGISGFLMHGTTGRTTAMVATLLALVGGLVWFFLGGRRRKSSTEIQPS
jgi:hypothetical protein